MILMQLIINNRIMKRILIWLAFPLLLSTACNKVLEQKPQTSLDPADAFSTKEGVQAGLIGIYDVFQSGSYWGLRYWVFADLYADNLMHTGTFPSFAQVANKQLLADNVEISNMWNTIYDGINRANGVIFYAAALNDASFNKNAAIAEARALRGIMYFDLLRYFGGTVAGYNKPGGLGVPLYLTPTLKPEDAAPKPRATEAEVYAAILADLDFGIANIPVSNPNGRLNKNAVTAMKARVQLYREQWDDAETLATSVISQFAGSPNGGLVSGAEYITLYLNKNVKPESLWELQFFTDDANSIAFFYYTGATGGRNEITSSSSLANAHEAGDLRRPINVSVASPGPPAVPANKTRKYSRIPGDDNVIMIRLAELYLIRAEARARKTAPDIAGAQADINRIRNRAGLANTTAVTVQQLVDAVEQERRIELAHEGHRFFDVRRYNKLASIGITQSFRALWPIPLREFQTSGGIIAQNPNY